MSYTSAPAVLDMPHPGPRRAVIGALLLILTDGHAPTLLVTLATGLAILAVLLGIARSLTRMRDDRAGALPRLGSRPAGYVTTTSSTRFAGSAPAHSSCVRP